MNLQQLGLVSFYNICWSIWDKEYLCSHWNTKQKQFNSVILFLVCSHLYHIVCRQASPFSLAWKSFKDMPEYFASRQNINVIYNDKQLSPLTESTCHAKAI